MVTKNRLKRDFSQIPNDLICDSTLANSSYRIAMYLFSRPDNWRVNNKDISNVTSIKDKNTICKAFNELIERGWVSREHERDEKGRLTGNYDYTLHEQRIISEIEQIRFPKKSDFRKNHIHNNTESLNNTELSTTIKDAQACEEKDNLPGPEENTDRSAAPQAPQATENADAASLPKENTALMEKKPEGQQQTFEAGAAAALLEQSLVNSLLEKNESPLLPYDSASAYKHLTALMASPRDRQRVLSSARRANVSDNQLDAFTREFCGKFENYHGGRNVRSAVSLESRYIKWLSTHDFTWKGLSYMDREEFIAEVEAKVPAASETAKATWAKAKAEGHVNSLVKVFSDMSNELQSLPTMQGVTPAQWAMLFLELPTRDLRKKVAAAVRLVADKSYYRNQFVSVDKAIREAVEYNNK